MTVLPRALVLAAGLGTGLAPLTDALPKPVFPVLNRPIIGYVLDRLRSAGIRDVAINTHHLAAALRECLGDGRKWGVHLTYFHEDLLLGAGGAIRHTAPWWQGHDLVVTSADMLSTLDIADLIAFHSAYRPAATAAAIEHKWTLDEWEGDVAVTDAGGSLVTAYQYRPGVAAGSRLATTGTWVVSDGLLPFIGSGFQDINRDVLPTAARNGQVRVHVSDHTFDDFGVSDRYVEGSILALRGRLGLDMIEGAIVGSGALVAPDARLEGAVLIGPSTSIGPGCHVVGPTVIGGGCIVEAGCTIRESVVLPGTTVSAGTVLMRGFLANRDTTPAAIRHHHLDVPISAGSASE